VDLTVELVVEARLLHLSRRLRVAGGAITDGAGKLYASAARCATDTRPATATAAPV
jgi:acyl-coenzyme A thioesterase PaaI-like protein